jgi:nucleotide-binding universal stress UspA family protein
MEVLGKSPIPVMVTGPEIVAPNTAEPYVLLVTTDGSRASEVVLEALGRLPGRQNIQMVLTSIYLPTLGDRGNAAEVGERERLLGRLRQRYLSDVPCDCIVRSAPEFKTAEMMVLELAAERRATAIAMSTRGHSVARHVVLGSFAAAVLGRSPVPLVLSRA